MTETTSGPARGSRAKAGKAAAAAPAAKGLRIERIHTTPGTHPYDEVVWERRDVVMTNWRDGSINFEQRGVEFPNSWSVNAVNIVTSKYFRGAVGTPQRETGLRCRSPRASSWPSTTPWSRSSTGTRKRA